MIEEDKKQINLDEIKRLLRDSENENNNENERKLNLPNNFKQIRKGILVFLLIQLLFEISMTLIFSNNAKYIGLHLILNFTISNFYTKNKLEKNKISKETDYFIYGLKTAFIIFIIRLILGLFF